MRRSKISASAGARHLRTAPKATDNPMHLVRVRLLSCCASGLPGHVCSPRIVAHHAGRHGIGQRCTDLEAIAMCDAGHRELHEVRGPFKGWSRDEVRSWEDGQILVTQRTLGVTP